MKPNWVCTECNMYSSRRYNVKRHIDSIHSGMGGIISFIEYLSGVRAGNYIPKSSPTYKKSKHPSKIFADEFYRELARQCVDKAPKNLTCLYLKNLLPSIDEL